MTKTISKEAVTGYFKYLEEVKKLQGEIKSILEQHGYNVDFCYEPGINEYKGETSLHIPFSVKQPVTTG